MSDREDRRKQILNAAERLLQHYGPFKTTVSDIAKEARVGVGSVYLEFSSKDEIIAALSSQRHSRILQQMRDAATSEADSAQRLKAVLRIRLECFMQLSKGGPHASDLVHCGCSAVEQAYAEYRAAEHKLLEELLLEGMQQGNFAIQDPRLTTIAILQALASFSPPWLFKQNPDDLLPTFETLQTLLLHGLTYTTSQK